MEAMSELNLSCPLLRIAAAIGGPPERDLMVCIGKDCAWFKHCFPQSVPDISEEELEELRNDNKAMNKIIEDQYFEIDYFKKRVVELESQLDKRLATGDVRKEVEKG